MDNGQSTKIPCAIIGLGRIGSTLEEDALREKPASHAGAITACPETMLVAGADTEPKSRAAFAARWQLGHDQVFDDTRTMLSSCKPLIVHIAAPSETHIPLLELCLEMAIPVIVLEKPVAANVLEARQILPAVRAAERSKRSRIVVNHERRFSLDYQTARQLLTSGQLGKTLSVHARLFFGQKRSIAKMLWHDGTHMVDIIRYLCGDWQVKAVVPLATAAGNACLAIGQNNGTDIYLEAAAGRDHLVFELDISCSKGRIRIGNGLFEQWQSGPSPYSEQFRSLHLVGSQGNERFPATGYFANMLAHAVELLKNTATPLQSSFEDGMKALALIDEILNQTEC